MATYQQGDKVKFLNHTGGGIVTKVTADFVFVQDDTGFELPMQPGELIRMADMQGAGKMFNDQALQQRHTKDAMPTPDRKDPAPAPEDEIKHLRSQVASLRDQVDKLKKQLANMQRLNSRKITDNVLLQHEVARGEAEVDLHIEMLCENPGALAPHEAFQTQMRYFRTCMNHAIMNHYQKVTFIHGAGKGILKDEMLKELKQYSGLHYFDAPMSKYGAGATEVYFGNDAEAPRPAR